MLLATAVLIVGAVAAYAKGGTAKPPPGALSPFVTPTLPDPAFTASPAAIHGFDETGFIQDATVSSDNSDCPDVAEDNRLGGTVTINNVRITVPCNMVVQMPANTIPFACRPADASCARGRGRCGDCVRRRMRQPAGRHA
jgi:hypothetical protein